MPLRAAILPGALLLCLLGCRLNQVQLPEPRFQPHLTEGSGPRIFVGRVAADLGRPNQHEHSLRRVLVSFIASQGCAPVASLSVEERPGPDDLIVDVQFRPRYQDDFNWWWTWPAIYPLIGLWPVQWRRSVMRLRVELEFARGAQRLPAQSFGLTGRAEVKFYGFFRVQPVHRMIRRSYSAALELAARRICAVAAGGSRPNLGRPRNAP